MITEDYVSFEVAKLLKEKGFNWQCHATYDIAVTGGKPQFSEYEVLNYFPYGMKNSDDKYGMVISAPTHQMAMKWLREVYDIKIMIRPYVDGTYSYEILNGFWYVNFDSYENAVEESIKYCLENLI